MRMHRLLSPAFVLAALAAPACAETLYKLIDKKGKVTYVQEKPRDFDGQVIPVEIDMKANTATLPKYTPPAKPAAPATAPKGKDPLAQARARVDSARRAFENARDNPGDNDVRWLGNVKGGTRPVPTEEYLQKLARLENELNQAEEDLRKLQGGR